MYLEVLILRDVLLRLLLFGALCYLLKKFGKEKYYLKLISFIFLSVLLLNYLSIYFVNLFALSQNISKLDYRNYHSFNPFAAAIFPLVLLYLSYKIIAKYRRLSLAETIGRVKNKRYFVKWVLYITLCYIPIKLAFQKILFSYDFPRMAQLPYIIPKPAMWALVGAILIPISEELIFRAIIYTEFRNKINIFWSVMLTSVLFVLFHAEWTAAIWLFLSSIVYCYSYEKSKCLLIPIIAHGLSNLSKLFFRTTGGIRFILAVPNSLALLIILGSLFLLGLIHALFKGDIDKPWRRGGEGQC